MELKPGYKQTEVGVIPEDWETDTLLSISCQIMDFRGRTPKKLGTEWGGGDIPALSAGNVRMGFVDFKEECYFGSEQLYRRWMTKGDLAKDDIVFTTEAPLGNVALVPDNRRYILSQRTVLLQVDPNRVSSRFLFQVMLSGGFQRMLADYASGSTARGIQRKKFEQLCVPIPPLHEQGAIAAALGDVDALLDRLDRIIAKKRDLKQAAMQQLLTGQIRLPGFHGEWEVKRLGDHVAFLRNGTNSRAELTQDDPVKYLHYGDVHACAGTQLRPNALPSIPSEKAKSLARLQDGDLVFADASEDLAGVSKSVEMRGVADTETVPGLHTIAARFDKSALADGFKSYLQFCTTFSGQLRRLAAGTKVYATNRAHIASIEMRLPGVEEQTAIAAVLSDMDAELSALEMRRDKTRNLKQGMMQELLTGRTRLI